MVKRYGEDAVVDAVSFSVESGSLFGLLGPNGSGKSTTVKMLCGLVAASAGSARVGGFDSRSRAGAARLQIGYMAQGFALYRDLTCDENLEFCARAYGLSPSVSRARKRVVYELTGTGRFKDQRAGRLSGGWQRRLGLAAALLHDPTVLFLDEPTAGVDPVARRELWDLFYELAAGGKTFFITTHDMDEARRCSRIGYMLEGALLVCGTIAEVRGSHETLEDALVALVGKMQS
ncbi:MAG: ABC transporter ATP-binding protein [Candidatus Tyrphobacter sp.]